MTILKKRTNLLPFFIFLLSTFVFIFIETADARAGGGGGRSGGGRSGGRRSSRSYRSSSSRPSRPLTEAERQAQANNFKKEMSKALWLIPLHFLCFGILRYRFKLDENGKSIKKQNTTDGCSWGDFGFIVLILFIVYPILLLFDILVIIFAAISLYKFKRLVPIGYESELKRKLKIQSILTGITNSNPGFDENLFIERIKRAFYKIQRCWSNQNLSGIRLLLADGTFEQFQIQIKEMNKNNTVDIMKDIVIHSISYEKHEFNNNYDSVYVYIRASSINYRLNTKSNQIIEGSKSYNNRFAEIWCFTKKSGVNASVKNGLIENVCPNCSSKIKDTSIDKCMNCGAEFKNGKSDWVLTGIYQEDEWRENHNSDIPGLNKLLESDPDFNIQSIEDKLSVIFWRLIEATAANSVNPILKISDNTFINEFNSRIMNSIFYKHERAGIDSIEIVGIYQNGNDYFLFAKIIWNGRESINSYPEHFKSLFVLKRNISCKTDINKYFCGAHCPNCGAEETYNNSNICEFCNKPANDDTKEWILFDIRDFNDPLAKNAMNKARVNETKMAYERASSTSQTDKTPIDKKAEVLKYEKYLNNTYSSLGIDWKHVSRYSKKDFLRLIIAIMLADGVIDYREIELIRNIGKLCDISEREIQNCINELQNSSNPIKHILTTTNLELDKDLLRTIILIAAIDGEITDTELNILKKIADKILISDRELMDMINQIYEIIWNKKINLEKELYLFN